MNISETVNSKNGVMIKMAKNKGFRIIYLISVRKCWKNALMLSPARENMFELHYFNPKHMNYNRNKTFPLLYSKHKKTPAFEKPEFIVKFRIQFSE
jgi:hypothetical protein